MIIQGNIEDIIFKNDENGYVVAKIATEDGTSTIVGCMPSIIEGQNLKLTGEWVNHPQFGEQFKVSKSEEVLPTTKDGVIIYLSSGVIEGIGPVTAKKIVDYFGDETLNVLDNHLERLSEVAGIGEKKLKIIKESYRKSYDLRKVMIFFESYGVTPNQALKMYKRFGEESIEIVSKNPYILTEEVNGIGFKTADKIARALGIDFGSPFRVEAAIKYIVNEFCTIGNTYMPLDMLLKEGNSLLGLKEEEIMAIVYEISLKEKIKVCKIEDKDCVFNMPFYYSELSVTKKLLTLSSSNKVEIYLGLDKDIEDFEIEKKITLAQPQKEAIKGAFNNFIEVITGGPGTGKTTIINCIVELFEKNKKKVLMAAPTGRAAKRMTEACNREAKTIHRLLELGYGEEEDAIFNKNEEEPLECDVLIVDEASMIDIMLMNSLLKAIKKGTRLIIVGDVDQLPSVGPGNVLRDIIESNCIKVFRLKDIYRQKEQSTIVLNAHRVNDGEMPLLNEKNGDFYFINGSDNYDILKILLDLVENRLPKFNEKWDRLKHIQILTPMRKGNLGVVNLNKCLQEILNPKKATKAEKEYKEVIFRTGDKIMQIKNNYNLKWRRIAGVGEQDGTGVFNGDVGFIEEVDNKNGMIKVIFDEEREVLYENVTFEELEHAYAITIHKSQGSEFPVIVMPAFMGPPMLMNKNIFYTAITRAKKLVVLVGQPKAISYMVNNKNSVERYSSLKYRMQSFKSGPEDNL